MALRYVSIMAMEAITSFILHAVYSCAVQGVATQTHMIARVPGLEGETQHWFLVSIVSRTDNSLNQSCHSR